MEQEAASSSRFRAFRFFGDEGAVATDTATATIGGGFLWRRGEVRRNGAADAAPLAADTVASAIEGDAMTAARDAITAARVTGLEEEEERRCGGSGGSDDDVDDNDGSVTADSCCCNAERRNSPAPAPGAKVAVGSERDGGTRLCCSDRRARNDANVVDGDPPAVLLLLLPLC